jgi:uncharacterized protein
VRLPKHPFPVRTVFRRCFLANFGVDAGAMRRVLPHHIDPDLHEGEAYLSVVVGQMERMRPTPVPRPLGITYNQIVYRAVVRCGAERGVHFLRSDADSPIMCALGNAMSFFRFHRSAITFSDRDGHLDLDVTTKSAEPGGIRASYDLDAARHQLPATSAFTDLGTAQQWLVELFTAFDHTAGSQHIDAVRIDRGEWEIKVVDDHRAEYDFLTAGPFGPGNTRLDSVFLVGDVPYRWHRLERLPLPG